MAVDYDAWLEEPFQRMCREQEAWEHAEAQLRDDKAGYAHSLSDWLEENPSKTEADFPESETYAGLVQNIIDGWESRDEEW